VSGVVVNFVDYYEKDGDGVFCLLVEEYVLFVMWDVVVVG